MYYVFLNYYYTYIYIKFNLWKTFTHDKRRLAAYQKTLTLYSVRTQSNFLTRVHETRYPPERTISLVPNSRKLFSSFVRVFQHGGKLGEFLIRQQANSTEAYLSSRRYQSPHTPMSFIPYGSPTTIQYWFCHGSWGRVSAPQIISNSPACGVFAKSGISSWRSQPPQLGGNSDDLVPLFARGRNSKNKQNDVRCTTWASRTGPRIL